MVIDGKTIMLESQTKFWQNPNKKFEFEFNCFLTPKQKIVNTDTLRKESIIVTQAMRQLREAWCNGFFIGQNGGFKNTADLIWQVKAMIKYSRCKYYVVVSFHKPNDVMPTSKRMGEMEDSLQLAFGNRYINQRRHMMNRGLQEAGFIPTQEDKDGISHGKVPPQLMVDGCHFKKEGYRIIAQLVKQKIDRFK